MSGKEENFALSPFLFFSGDVFQWFCSGFAKLDASANSTGISCLDTNSTISFAAAAAVAAIASTKKIRKKAYYLSLPFFASFFFSFVSSFPFAWTRSLASY